MLHTTRNNLRQKLVANPIQNKGIFASVLSRDINRNSFTSLSGKVWKQGRKYWKARDWETKCYSLQIMIFGRFICNVQRRWEKYESQWSGMEKNYHLEKGENPNVMTLFFFKMGGSDMCNTILVKSSFFCMRHGIFCTTVCLLTAHSFDHFWHWTSDNNMDFVTMKKRVFGGNWLNCSRCSILVVGNLRKNFQ